MDREAWQQFMESQRVGHDLVTKHTSTTRKTGGRSKGDASCPTNLPESSPLESILAEPWVHRQEGSLVSQGNLETNPINIKPKTVSQVAGSLGPPSYCSFPGEPLHNKVSCFASTCVSSNNSLLSVRQELTPVTYIHCAKIPHFQLINTFITSPFLFCLIRTFKSHSLLTNFSYTIQCYQLYLPYYTLDPQTLFKGFPCGSAGKECGRPGFDP